MATVSIYNRPDLRELTHYNINNPDQVTSSAEGIIIRAPPDTDLWRDPGQNVSTAPTLYTRVPMSNFKSARVTVSSNWNTIWDQGGLVLFLRDLPRDPPYPQSRWVKVNIEYFEQPDFATVATDNWSDYSYGPVPGVGYDYVKGGKVSATLEVEREVVDGRKTSSLLVYKVDPKTGGRQLVRGVTWVFEEDVGELLVGIYAASPKSDDAGRDDLEVNFRGFEIKLFQ